ncbi:protein-S-isoprenylcysteine O-methyltransferase [Thermoproteota archaeon]
MEAIVYKIIFMVLFVLAAAFRAPYAHKARKAKIVASKRKLFEKVLLLPIGSVMLILPLFVVFTVWFDVFNLSLPMWLRLIGAVGFAFAVFIHNWAHIALEENFAPFVELHENHKLVTFGPYKYVIHPMYTAFFLWSIFQGLLLDNWLVLVTGFITFLIVYTLRVKHEEQLMIEKFGQRYRSYMKKTGRLFPKF